MAPRRFKGWGDPGPLVLLNDSFLLCDQLLSVLTVLVGCTMERDTQRLLTGLPLIQHLKHDQRAASKGMSLLLGVPQMELIIIELPCVKCKRIYGFSDDLY